MLVQIDYVIKEEPGPITEVIVQGPGDFSETIEFEYDRANVLAIQFDNLEVSKIKQSVFVHNRVAKK